MRWIKEMVRRFIYGWKSVPSKPNHVMNVKHTKSIIEIIIELFK